MLSCSTWFSAPSFWMGGGLENRCVGRVYGADGARHRPHRTHDRCAVFVHTGRSLTDNTILVAILIQFDPLIMNTELLETCTGLKREERKPTRRNNIDDLLPIVDVDY